MAALLKRISALEAEVAIARATYEATVSLHEKQVENLMAEAMLRQIAQQRAEARLMEPRRESCLPLDRPGG